MLIRPTCDGHFEARKAPWRGHPGDVYICAARRRKPGVCTNTLALAIVQADDDLLSTIEGAVLAPSVIEELLALLDANGDDVAALTRERDRLTGEVQRLMDSIAAGVPADSVASAIREREREVQSLDARLRAPREAPDRTRLRAALPTARGGVEGGSARRTQGCAARAAATDRSADAVGRDGAARLRALGGADQARRVARRGRQRAVHLVGVPNGNRPNLEAGVRP